MQDFLSFLNDDTYKEFKAAGGDISKLSDKAYEEVKLAHKVARPEPLPTEHHSPVLSAAQGLASNVTMGLDDEIGGGVTALAKTAMGQDTSYEKERDKIRASKEMLEKDNPKSYTAGAVVGGLGTAALTGGGSIAGQAARAGGEGVVRSLGDADSINEETLSKAVKSGAIDAVTAGTLAKVAPALVAKAGEMGDAGAAWLKKLANSQAVKSLGGTKGQVEKLGGKADEVGAMLLENKIVTPLASSKTVADRVSQQGEKLAADTVPIYEQAKDARLPAQHLYDEIEAHVADLQSNPGNAPIIKKLKGYQDDLVNSGTTEFNPAEIRKYRQAVDKTINFNSDAPSQVASKEMRGILRDKEMGLINDIDPELAKQNEKLFKNIHLNILAEDMAEKGAAKSAVNNEIGLNTWQAGTQAAAAGATGGASMAAMAAREFAKRYGNQMSAVALDKVSKAMQSNQFGPMFAKAAEKGPSAVAALHQALMSKPEYKAMVGGK